MTAKDIQKALLRYYESSRYVVPNVYFFGNGYGETDLLVVKEGKGFVYDIEVKISRGDYFADFKKTEKHEIIEKGTRTSDYKRSVPNGQGGWSLFEENTPIETKERPNRFYFAVPTDKVKVSEVPEYAGLLYVSETGRVTKVKEARLLHTNILEPEKTLCRKFYYAALELRQYKEDNGVATLKAKVARLENELLDKNTKLLQQSNELFLLKHNQKQTL